LGEGLRAASRAAGVGIADDFQMIEAPLALVLLGGFGRAVDDHPGIPARLRAAEIEVDREVRRVLPPRRRSAEQPKKDPPEAHAPSPETTAKLREIVRGRQAFPSRPAYRVQAVRRFPCQGTPPRRRALDRPRDFRQDAPAATARSDSTAPSNRARRS